MKQQTRLLVGLFLLVVGCRQEAAQTEAREARRVHRVRPTEPPRLRTIIGLFESGAGLGRDRLCVVEHARRTEFALVIRGEGGDSCSGSGSIRRRGGRLHFVMSGDSSCTFDAVISGDSILFPERVAKGCAYYCGKNARLTNVRLTQSGATEAAAMRATDLVGEPLCTSE